MLAQTLAELECARGAEPAKPPGGKYSATGSTTNQQRVAPLWFPLADFSIIVIRIVIIVMNKNYRRLS